eukprot:5919872-Alexandrium_andersonii.AAC.1
MRCHGAPAARTWTCLGRPSGLARLWAGVRARGVKKKFVFANVRTCTGADQSDPQASSGAPRIARPGRGGKRG